MSGDTPPAHGPAGLAPGLRRDATDPLLVVRPGTVGYRAAWELQREVVTRRQADVGHDVLFLLDHPRVFTLGPRTDRAHLLFDESERIARGIELVEVDRGGDVTYHGPGQLVGYPILRLASLRGVVDYVRALEEVVLRVVASFGLVAARIPGMTGVWVGDEKIAAIGVRVASRGVTSHGFALNVHTDPDDFVGIVPCGIADRGVTSLAALGVEVGLGEVADRTEHAVAEVFAATLRATTLDEIGLSSTPTA